MNVTSSVLHALRRDLFPPNKFVWATEVSVPSRDTVRRMDAATIDARTEPFCVDGFEVKVSRADWRNDRDGAKSRAARHAVDRFWFVFGSPDIYTPSEVPAACGIIHVVDGRAEIVRQPAAPDGNISTYCRALVSTILTRTLRADSVGFVKQVERTAEARGYQKGLSAAKRRNITTTRRGETRLKYNPGRYNLDDGVPLDLP